MDSTRPNVQSDEELVARAKRDREAFGGLYDRYVDQVYQFAYRRVKNHATAEEITSRVFHRALEQLAQFEWRGIPFGAWLVRIAVNLIHDHNGQAQRHVALQNVPESHLSTSGDDTSLEERYAAHQASDVVWQAAAALPLMQQQVLVLRFVREMSIQEIAAAMGRTEGAVKQLLFRAIKRLRQQLQQIGFDHGA
jgi:RNA polymerase sigma-70 factor (ECF subfamily)